MAYAVHGVDGRARHALKEHPSMDLSRHLLAVGIASMFVAPTSPSHAQQTAPAPSPAGAAGTPAAQTAPASGGSQPLTHDGFYLSGALGFGRMRDDMTLTVDLFGLGQKYEGHAEGFSVGGHLFAGYTVTKALVVGGGIFFDQVTDPEIELENSDVGDDVSVGTLVLIGPGVVWYPDKHGGFHLLGAVGGARIELRDDSDRIQDHSPVGGGIAIGVGYDFFIGDEWSAGVLLRGVGATLSDDNLTHKVTAGSLMLGVTYH
jgi:hypothetical protein